MNLNDRGMKRRTRTQERTRKRRKEQSGKETSWRKLDSKESKRKDG